MLGAVHNLTDFFALHNKIAAALQLMPPQWPAATNACGLQVLQHGECDVREKARNMLYIFDYKVFFIITT
jgi:hypothetical protein